MAFAVGYVIGLTVWWTLVQERTWVVPPNQHPPEGDWILWMAGSLGMAFLGGSIAAVATIRIAEHRWPWPIGRYRGEPNMTWPWLYAWIAIPTAAWSFTRAVWPVRAYDDSASPTVTVHDSPLPNLVACLLFIALSVAIYGVGIARGRRSAAA
ncbi:MAG: hypothetical protein U0869_23675 [Chloroflexota bacterium]